MQQMREALVRAGYKEPKPERDPERDMCLAYAAEEWLAEAQIEATHGG